MIPTPAVFRGSGRMVFSSEHLRSEIVIFDPENTRSGSADIAGIESISTAFLLR
jgi:hypothetical protein